MVLSCSSSPSVPAASLRWTVKKEFFLLHLFQFKICSIKFIWHKKAHSSESGTHGLIFSWLYQALQTYQSLIIDSCRQFFFFVSFQFNIYNCSTQARIGRQFAGWFCWGGSRAEGGRKLHHPLTLEDPGNFCKWIKKKETTEIWNFFASPHNVLQRFQAGAGPDVEAVCYGICLCPGFKLYISYIFFWREIFEAK